MSGKPAKKTKAQIEAEKAAAEAAAEAERVAAEAAAEAERLRREAEAAAARAAEEARRRAELAVLAAEYEVESCARRQFAERVAEALTAKHKAAAWEREAGGGASTVDADEPASLHTFITQYLDGDEFQKRRVLEGTGTLLAPAAYVGTYTGGMPGSVGSAFSSGGGGGPLSFTAPSAAVGGGLFSGNVGALPALAGTRTGMASPGPGNASIFGTPNAVSFPPSVGVGFRPQHAPPAHLPAVRGGEEPITPFTPGFAACSTVAATSDALERALADAVQQKDVSKARVLHHFMRQLQQLTVQRVDALTYSLLDAAYEYGVELKDGVREVHVAHHFDALPPAPAGDSLSRTGGGGGGDVASAAAPDDAVRSSQQSFVQPHVAGEVVVWANVGSAKVLRTKTVRNTLSKDKLAPKEAEAGSTLSVDLHKAVASLASALRLMRVDTDIAPVVSSMVREQEEQVARLETGQGDVDMAPRDATGMARSRSGPRSASARIRVSSAMSRHSSMPGTARQAEGKGDDEDGSGEGKADDRKDEADAGGSEAKEDGEHGIAEDGDDSDEEGDEDTERSERLARGGPGARALKGSNAAPVGDSSVEFEKMVAASALHAIGGNLIVELLQLPPSGIALKSWLMTRIPPAQSRPFVVYRQPHPAAGQGTAATAQAVKVRMRVPEHVIVPHAGQCQVGHWVRLPVDSPLQSMAQQVADGVASPTFAADLALALRHRHAALVGLACARVLQANRSTTSSNATASLVAAVPGAASWLLPSYMVRDAMNKLASLHVPAAESSAPAGVQPEGVDAVARQQVPGYWKVDDILDVSYDASSRVLSFATLHMAPHALVQPRYLDVPYSSWSLTPVHSSRVLRQALAALEAKASKQADVAIPAVNSASTSMHGELVQDSNPAEDGVRLSAGTDVDTLLGTAPAVSDVALGDGSRGAGAQHRSAATFFSDDVPLSPTSNDVGDSLTSLGAHGKRASQRGGGFELDSSLEGVDMVPEEGAPGANAATVSREAEFFNHASILRLDTPRFTVGILVQEDGMCRLVAPTHVPELRWLTGSNVLTGEGATVVPPGQLLHLLARCGIHLLPTDMDAALLNVDRAKAMQMQAKELAVAASARSQAEPEPLLSPGTHASFAALGPDGDAIDAATAAGVHAASIGAGDASDSAHAGEKAKQASVWSELRVHAPVVCKDAQLELAVYRDVAHLAGCFSLASSRWNALPGTSERVAVLRACETVLGPVVPGHEASTRSATDAFMAACAPKYGEVAADAPSEAHTAWRMVSFARDEEAACVAQVRLVRDEEPRAVQAWTHVLEHVRYLHAADAVVAYAATHALALGGTEGGENGALPPADAGAGGATTGGELLPSSHPDGGPATTTPDLSASLGPVPTWQPFSNLPDEGGSPPHVSAARALAGRISQEASDSMARTPPLLVHAVADLLGLIRPLSFTQ